ncbi:protein suppressor of hairy wing-like [Spodoptera frugiperda]|uniref:Protein suppressor of hairy wing-like n=1 Tax=Spodoptera frugiperda TaxID=7108 RepID=A0A9R0F290_SPOFR|nr:protein suppressor of hairy wing-like [Spodoptera frugiperda]
MFRSCKDVSFESKPKENEGVVIDEGFLCDLCTSGPFSTELDVDIHRRNTHKWEILKALRDEDVPICSICLYIQKDKESLIQHILTNHLCCAPDAKIINRELFICDYCNRLFFNKDLLITHIYHYHIPKEVKQVTNIRHNCPKCLKIIPGKSTWFHLLYHGIFNSRTCPVCLSSFNRNTEVLNHMKNHKPYLKCNICGFTTMKERFFASHLEKHKKDVYLNEHGDVSKYFTPQHTFPSLQNRQSHTLKGVPLANEVRICVLCRAVCLTYEEMVIHIHGDHLPDEKAKTKKYQCLCGEDFFNNVLLKHHVFKMRSGHAAEAEESEDGVVRHVCTCGLQFPNSLLLKHHLVQVNSVHGVCDGTEMVTDTQTTNEIVFPDYEIDQPMEVNVGDLVIGV